MERLFNAYFNSPIGTLEIKGTEAFITHVHFVDGDFPTSKPNFPPTLVSCIQQLDEYFKGERKSFDLPINLLGTEEEKTVWTELQKLDYGKPITYISLANRLHDTRSIMAIDNANSHNPLSILVPNHRIVGAQKSIVGFLGGLWRKNWLLNHELDHIGLNHKVVLV